MTSSLRSKRRLKTNNNQSRIILSNHRSKGQENWSLTRRPWWHWTNEARESYWKSWKDGTRSACSMRLIDRRKHSNPTSSPGGILWQKRAPVQLLALCLEQLMERILSRIFRWLPCARTITRRAMRREPSRLVSVTSSTEVSELQVAYSNNRSSLTKNFWIFSEESGEMSLASNACPNNGSK